MAAVSTYLNFDGNTEQAFEFYKSVFGTDYIGGIMRMGDLPAQEGMPPMPDDVKNKIMNVQLPILGGHILMGTDVLEGYGSRLVTGNNVHIVLRPDTREEADALFVALSAGGEVGMPMTDQFWGDYYGAFTDKFGIGWMIDHQPGQ
ncbi:MAG: VOC family protein [Thermomicrobiales bacterium]|nr:VOC family protein [Thermomicrobiales bacterium]